MRDAQQQAADFAREHGLSLSAQGRFIDLVSEIGELGKEILKATGYETEPFTNHKEITQEMGDCLFFYPVSVQLPGTGCTGCVGTGSCKNMRSDL